MKPKSQVSSKFTFVEITVIVMVMGIIFTSGFYLDKWGNENAEKENSEWREKRRLYEIEEQNIKAKQKELIDINIKVGNKFNPESLKEFYTTQKVSESDSLTEWLIMLNRDGSVVNIPKYTLYTKNKYITGWKQR